MTTNQQKPEPAPADDNKSAVHNAIWTHVLPFGAWLLLMSMLSPPTGWGYAIRTFVCLGLFLWMCPWRWYEPLKIKHLPAAFLVGLLVFVVWVFPESHWMSRFPTLQNLYLRICILPPWKMPEPLESLPYNPYVCGWWLTGIRLFGSAVVVALIEEFFWRGFLYRWLMQSNFLKLDVGFFHASTFFIVAALFGIEHNRWLVGILAGLIYGYFMIRTRDIWAVVVAHGVTNYLLGLYVLAYGRYEFW